MPALCVIPGDGIGQEVIPAAVLVLKKVIPGLETVEAEAGWECFLNHGVSVPEKTLATVRKCGAALFGAVSSPSRKVEGYRSAIITLRQSLNLYANIRPVWSLPQVSPKTGVNMLIVRENTEGLYAGREHMEGETAIAERVITPKASYRIAAKALVLMQTLNRKHLTIVHKANVLPLTDGLFRDTVLQVVKESGLPVVVDELLVDVAALKIVSQPEAFDVLVTTNLFGDILSDEASYWMGGLGFAPSLNFGDGVALAEPVHGSAPDIAGNRIANPMAAILSAALLVRHAWKMDEIATAIEQAVVSALEQGYGLPDPDTGRYQSTDSILQAVMKEF